MVLHGEKINNLYMGKFLMKELTKSFTQLEAEKFVKSFIAEVWCEQNADKIPEHYTSDFIGYMNGNEIFYYDDLIERVKLSKKSFKTNVAEFHDIFIISKILIGARVSMKRFGFDDNKSNVNICMIIEVLGNKVKKIWLFTDQDYKYKGWEE